MPYAYAYVRRATADGEIEDSDFREGRRGRQRGRSGFFRGHPYMTSALRGGGGVSPKEDVVREVA